MNNTPTFWQWLKNSKANRNILIVQCLIALVMVIAVLFNGYDLSYQWAFGIGIFLTTFVFISLLRAIFIYIRLLRIDYFTNGAYKK